MQAVSLRSHSDTELGEPHSDIVVLSYYFAPQMGGVHACLRSAGTTIGIRMYYYRENFYFMRW